MSEPADDPSVKRMHLRYNGRCRLCDTALAAGTLAVYERPLRAVRCIDCDTASAEVHRPVSSAEPAPPVRAAPAEDLRLRAPASAVITELLRVQSSAAPRSGASRFFGRTPLTAESESWFRGAIGELEVGRILDGLDASWLVIHAVPIGTAGSDIDHLVIGPAGLFTINTKYHEGAKVWVASKRLLVNGQRTDHLRNSAFEANRVAKLLTKTTGQPVEVTPIVAIVAARSITIRERPVDVAVVRANHLVRWLVRRPRQLTDNLQNQLATAALNPATWGDPAVPSPDLDGFAALRASVTTARRRRQSWAFLALLSPLAIFAAAFLSVFR